MNHTAQELAFAGPAALAGLVRRRELKPRELVELFLARIEQLDPQLNAYRVVMGEQALAEAAAATGSDGGGSIRIPAACCGLVGMKPSRGRVPGSSWVALSVFGALARTVRDSALVLDVLARPAGESFVKAAASEPGRLRIAA